MIWHLVDDHINEIEDTVIIDDKVRWGGKIEIVNGEVYVTGGFAIEELTILNNGNHTQVTLENLEKLITFNSNIPVDSLIVTVITHAEPNEELFFSAEFLSTESELFKEKREINIFPNPNKVNSNINVTLNNFINESIEVSVFDFSGKLLHQEKLSGKITNKRNTVNLNYKFDHGGNYFIVVSTGEKEYTKKVIVK